MRWRPIIVAAAVAALVAAGCGNNDADPAGGSPSSTVTLNPTTTSAVETSTTSSTPTTTEATEPNCADTEVLAVVDAAIERARLAPGEDWSSDVDDDPFAHRTAAGDEFAERLGLDCALRATQVAGEGQRLVLAAWTGPRRAYLIQAGDGPPTPYRSDATVDVLVDAPAGEFLDGDERSLWAGTLATGETVVVGHDDYVLGPVAKGWLAGPTPPSDEVISLDAERHAIAALDEAGMRNVAIAEFPELGSEEGFVQFISPTGQILAADVAPTGWFDPSVPRFYTGATNVEVIGDVDVRVTEPTEGDNLGFTRGAEFGWACRDFVWILEPPFNGDADEMRASVEAIVITQECRAG